MPTSFLKNIPLIIQAAYDQQPTSVLDVGVGRGKFGLLIREYLPSVTKLDGIEAWEPYLTGVQKSIYDQLIVGDILNTEVGQYDLYLMVDIIEHWDKEKAHKLFAKLLDKGRILISTPRAWIPQEAYEGNEFECHKSWWNVVDFDRYNRNQYACEDSLVLVLYK